MALSPEEDKGPMEGWDLFQDEDSGGGQDELLGAKAGWLALKESKGAEGGRKTRARPSCARSSGKFPLLDGLEGTLDLPF